MADGLTFLTVVPRVADPRRATQVARDVIRWSDELDMDGILLFTGAGAVLDPWLGASHVAASTRRLVPLIALNPAYAHPFTTARMLSSVVELYGRRVDLNLITGAALSELRGIGDDLDHADRYARLQEHVELLLRLLEGRPVDHEGRFYRTSGLQLSPAPPAALRPRLYVAGRSSDALRVAEAVGATRIGMLPPALDDEPAGVAAMNFGVIARPTVEEAEEAARVHFPDDPAGREMFQLSMANTDSVWKRRLAEMSVPATSGYRLDLFGSFQADCPYIVGDYDLIAEHIRRLVDTGVHTFLLDAPPTREEFQHLDIAVRTFRKGHRR
jgi:alkanesulfonate monooxygenase